MFYVFDIKFFILDTINLKFSQYGGAWVAQSVECLTLAQVMISQFVSSSPASGSMLTTQSLLGILDLVLSLCLSLKINKH